MCSITLLWFLPMSRIRAMVAASPMGTAGGAAFSPLMRAYPDLAASPDAPFGTAASLGFSAADVAGAAIGAGAALFWPDAWVEAAGFEVEVACAALPEDCVLLAAHPARTMRREGTRVQFECTKGFIAGLLGECA